VRISVVQRYPLSWVIERLRAVRLHKSTLRVYKDANIVSETIPPETVYPCQLYCLQSILDRLKELGEALRAEGIDLMNLDGAVEYLCEDRVFQVIPPVVETDRVTGLPIVCDGVHRLFIARTLERSCQVLWVKDPTVSYYADPNKAGWRDVMLHKDHASMHKAVGLKRWYRSSRNGYLTGFRDFNSVFVNVYVPPSRA
jgi:hypothetical protein